MFFVNIPKGEEKNGLHPKMCQQNGKGEIPGDSWEVYSYTVPMHFALQASFKAISEYLSSAGTAHSKRTEVL